LEEEVNDLTKSTRLKPEFRSLRSRVKQGWKALRIYWKDPSRAQELLDEMYEEVSRQ
jgi:hypothetical protein